MFTKKLMPNVLLANSRLNVTEKYYTTLVTKVTQRLQKVHHSSKVNEDQLNLDEVRKQFKQFEGGKITLTKDEKSGIAFICIDHEEKKNGFSGKMMVDLNEAVTDLEGWNSGKGLIFHSKGNLFSSGGYLETIKKISNPTDGYKMASLMHDSIVRLRQLPLISVALVNGKALGGGAEILLGPDFRLLTRNAEIAYVEARMGLGTGWGGGKFLKELIGHQKALDLLSTCRKVSAEEALQLGLADGIIKDEQNRLEKCVEWLNEKISDHDPFVVHTIKKILNSGDLDEEKRIFATSVGGPAQLRALSKNIKHK